MSNRKTELAGAVSALKAKGTQGGPKVGQIGLTDKTIYFNFFAGGMAGIISLIDPNTKREVGVTNLDGNKLNAGRDYVIDSIRFMNANGDASNTKDAEYTNGAIAALRAAEFRIVQGNKLLVDMPVSDLVGDLVGGTVANPITAGFRSISSLPLIQSNEEYAFELEFPKGVTTPTFGSGLNCRIEMRVHQAKR